MPTKRRRVSATKTKKPRRGRPKSNDLYPSLHKHPTPAERRAELLQRLRIQGVKPMDEATLDAMGEVWPEGENLDEFLAWLQKSRREGRYD